jgi:hypothetical protein
MSMPQLGRRAEEVPARPEIGRSVFQFVPPPDQTGKDPKPPIKGVFLAGPKDWICYSEEAFEYNTARPANVTIYSWPVEPGVAPRSGCKISDKWLAPFALQLTDSSGNAYWKVVALYCQQNLKVTMEAWEQHYGAQLASTTVSLKKHGTGTDTKVQVFPEPPDPRFDGKALVDALPDPPAGSPYNDKLSAFLLAELEAEYDRCQAILNGSTPAQSGVAQPAAQAAPRPQPIPVSSSVAQGLRAVQPPPAPVKTDHTEASLMAIRSPRELRALTSYWGIDTPSDPSEFAAKRRDIVQQILQAQQAEQTLSEGV